jgi:hypothetical protein
MLGLTKRLGRGVVVGALFMTLALASGGVARAADHPSGEGDNQLEMKAREAFAAGRYDEAIDTFAKLYAKTLNPVYLRNIGRCFQQKRQPQEAIDKFRDYLAKTKTGKFKISADERDEIEGYVKEMEALRDEQARAAAPPLPPVAPVMPLPAAAPSGAPPPAAPAPTAAPPTAMVTAAPSPAVGSEDHPIYTRWWFWTIIGVVAAGAAVGVVLAMGGTSKPDCPAGVTCK